MISTSTLLECTVCFYEYDSQQRLPKILPCGHTLCLVCLNELHSRQNGTVCPKDMAKFDIIPSSVTTNFAIIELLQPKKHEQIKQCEVHQNKADFFCKNEKKQICFLCLINEDHKGHEVLPIDKYILEMKPLIASINQEVLDKKSDILIELEQTKKSLSSIEEFEKESSAKIKESRQNLLDMIEQIFNEKQSFINEKLSEYKTNLTERINQMQTLLNKFDELSDFQLHDVEAVVKLVQQNKELLSQHFINLQYKCDLQCIINLNEVQQGLQKVFDLKINIEEIINEPLVINRVGSISYSWNYVNAQFDCLTFKSSKKIKLVGIGQFIPSISKNALTIKELSVLKGENTRSELVFQMDQELEVKNTSDQQKIHKILFSKPVSIVPGQFYTIKMQVLGNASYELRDGKAKCKMAFVNKQSQEDEVEIQFQNTWFEGGDVTNGTGVKSGQIPLLLIRA